jgi:hypothetical protein
MFESYPEYQVAEFLVMLWDDLLETWPEYAGEIDLTPMLLKLI